MNNSAKQFVRTMFLAIVVFVGCTIVAPTSFAFKLAPEGTAVEQAVAKKYLNWWRSIVATLTLKGLPHFSEPVHEEITHRIYGCDGDKDVCGNPDAGYATPYTIAGVRWNDDPPFILSVGQGKNTSCKIAEPIRFTTQPTCWVELFNDAKKKAEQNVAINAASGMSLLARSHFGDLQFLHSMASRDGEEALATKQNIFVWAEFIWRVASGEYSLSTRLKGVKIEGFEKYFGNTEWTVQDLLTLGNPALRPHVKEVAFGSLLHMVEDSFAKGHVDRAEAIQGDMCELAKEYPAPGRIRQFHAYGNQDTDEHGMYDSRNAFSAHWSTQKPSVIAVGQTIMSLLEKSSTWEQFKPYLECVYALENPNAKASAGDAFIKTK